MSTETHSVLPAIIVSVPWRLVAPLASILLVFCVQRRRRLQRAARERRSKKAAARNTSRQARLLTAGNLLVEREEEIEWQLEWSRLGLHRRF